MPRKNDDELRGAARHIAHDIRMLGRAYAHHQESAFAYTARTHFLRNEPEPKGANHACVLHCGLRY